MSSPETSLELDSRRQDYLLRTAWDSLRYGLRHGSPLPLDIDEVPPALRPPLATFVTLDRQGALRGCIGSLEAVRPLAVDVAHNAYSAAFEDPRFAPVGADEIDDLDLHISLLSTPEPFEAATEEELLAALRPGRDGLILEDGRHRATFLPSVWDTLPEPKRFVEHLKLKARLPADHWSGTLRFQRYAAQVIPPPA